MPLTGGGNMKHVQPWTVIGLAVALAACGGGGGSSGSTSNLAGCRPLGGAQTRATVSSPGCPLCFVEDEHLTVDSAADTFGALWMQGGFGGSVALLAQAQSGVMFPAGSEVGVLVMPHFGASAGVTLSLSTFSDNLLQEQFVLDVPVAGEHSESSPSLRSFETTAAYDGLELQFQRSAGSGTVRIQLNEFCVNF